MANINRQWRRVIAVGCSHGEALNRDIADDVLGFIANFKPEIRVHLGDVLDTTAFRAGAIGTPDENADVGVDQAAGISFLREYEATHISWGNHDWRLQKLMRSPRAPIAYAAIQCWNQLQMVVDELHAETRPYNLRSGWFDIGGYLWGHGYMYNINALRDHVHCKCRNVVMAHIHTPQMFRGRTDNPLMGYCVGMMGRIDHPIFDYAAYRPATLAWGYGAVVGEVTDDAAVLHLAHAGIGQRLEFPL